MEITYFTLLLYYYLIDKKHHLPQATVELLLFGKESTVELDIDQIDAVTA